MPETVAPIAHDPVLFDRLLDLAGTLDPDARSGKMFGCPAVFHGRKLAACVYGAGVGLKVPAELAVHAVASGRAQPFTPYGKPRMREWIVLSPRPDEIAGLRDLLDAALTYARTNNHEPAKNG